MNVVTETGSYKKCTSTWGEDPSLNECDLVIRVEGSGNGRDGGRREAGARAVPPS